MRHPTVLSDGAFGGFVNMTGVAPGPDVLPVGYRLADDYEVVRVLGAGGFGSTYLAKDAQLDREVAIKEYFPREIAFRDGGLSVRVKNERFQQSFQWGQDRFVQEGRLLARFRHPNIVRVFRTFDANATAYIVLDYVHGQDLGAWLEALGRLPTQDDLDELLTRLVDALALVHASGVLHRDIKPDNIRVREETGEPVLLDFGASKLSMGQITGTTMAIISRGYSPYEAYAADSGTQGPWTDIYSLGATVYRVLTGVAPPEATERLLDDTLPPLAGMILPGFRRDFLSAVDWAMRVRPNERPQAVGPWRERLFAGGTPTIVNWSSSRALVVPTGIPSGPVSRSSRQTGRSPSAAVQPNRKGRLAGVLTSIVLALIAGAGSLVAAVETGLIENAWLKAELQRLTNRTTVANRPVEEQANQLPGAASQPLAPPPTASPGTRANAPDVGAAPLAGATSSPGSSRPETIATAAAVAPPAPPLQVSPPALDYTLAEFGTIGDGNRVAVAAVAPDGDRIAAGGTDGSIRVWLTATGEEQVIATRGSAVLALDFIAGSTSTVVAAHADGRLDIADIASGRVTPLGRTSLADGFVRTVGYSSATRDIVTIETSGSETLMSRWSPDGGDGKATQTFSLGSYMVRAAAIARQAGTVFVVSDQETLLAFNARDGSARGALSRIESAPNWTTALALTSDGQQIARGGLYSTVEVFDIEQGERRVTVTLGNQAQTRALTFSGDGKHLAIAYIAFDDRLARHRIRVVEIASGRIVLDVESPQDRRQWLSFMPKRRDANWLAVTAAGQVRLCETTARCRLAESAP